MHKKKEYDDIDKFWIVMIVNGLIISVYTVHTLAIFAYIIYHWEVFYYHLHFLHIFALIAADWFLLGFILKEGMHKGIPLWICLVGMMFYPITYGILGLCVAGKFIFQKGRELLS